ESSSSLRSDNSNTLSNLSDGLITIPECSSDAGSDTNGNMRLFFGTSNADESPSTVVDGASNLVDFGETLEESDTANRSLSNSALMQEVSETDIFGELRQRRNSAGSVESNESSLSTMFSSIPGMMSSRRLETISSDVESESTPGSAFIGNASKEQISSVLHKLQGRAANYKDKYRELVKVYNEMVRENEKFRTVLAATQDKALQRIENLRNEKRSLAQKVAENDEKYKKDIAERDARIKQLLADREGSPSSEANVLKVKKLQEMLEKCKLSIKENKEKIHRLVDENEALKKQIEGDFDEQGISDLAVQRVTSEWKGRVDHLEAEWTKRLQDSEERATLAIAKVKAEMHAAIEERDSEVQDVRAKYKLLESQGCDAQGQIDELKSTIEALESEKADMLLKLSEAKQQGVKAVREEEEKKRQELVEEMQKKRDEDRREDERKLHEEVKKVEEQWRARFKEQEEQMQLAIEEREMQKVAAVIESDRKNENLGAMLEQLTAEKLQLVTTIDDMKVRHKQQLEEMGTAMESKDATYKEEVSALIGEHEHIVSELKREAEDAACARDEFKEQLEAAIKTNAKKIAELEAQLKDVSSDASSERKSSQKTIAQQAEELKKLRAESNEVRKLYEGLAVKLKEKETLLVKMANEQAIDSDEIAVLRQQLEHAQSSAANEEERLEFEIKELRMIVEEKSAMIRSLEAEKETLTVELAASQELSKMHEHLQDQLRLARDERNETEKKYLEMERRAEKATADLEEDRKLLAEARNELERSHVEVHAKLAEVAQRELTKEEVEKMRASIEQIKEEADTARRRLEEEASSLVIELAKIRDENANLSSKVSDADEQIRVLNIEKHSSVEEVKTMEEKLSTMTADLATKEEELDAMRQALKRNQEESEAAHIRKAELEKELGLKNDRIAGLTADLDLAQSAVKKLKEDEAHREGQQKKLEVELQSKTNEITRFMSALEEKLRDNEIFSSAKEEMGKLVEEERRKVSQLQGQLSALMTKTDGQLFSMQQELASRDASLKQLTEKLNEAEQRTATLYDNLRLTEEQLKVSEMEKISLADEMGTLKSDRDGLLERIDELEQEKSEELENLKRHLQTLRENAKQKEDELLAAQNGCKDFENVANARLHEQGDQIARLDAVNQKLRDEFLQKEAVVGELQKRIDDLTAIEKERLNEITTLKSAATEHQSQLKGVEIQMKNAQDETARISEQLKQSRAEEEGLRAKLATLQEEYKRKQEKEDEINEQYALALKNSNGQLEEAQKQLAELDLVRVEKDRLSAELSMAKEDCVTASAKAKEETERAVNEIKRKAEAKVAKIRKQCDADIQAAKAELLLQLNDMRTQIADRDLQIDELKLIIAELQQKLIDEGENERIINDLRLNIETIALERDNNAIMIRKLENELDGLRNATAEMQRSRENDSNENTALKKTVEELKAEIEQLNAKDKQSEDVEMKNRKLLEENAIYDNKVKELEAKIAETEKNADEQLKKAIAKADADRQRMLRDLQKEIKQLYQDLNERSEELAEANAKIENLMSQNMHDITENEMVQQQSSPSNMEPEKKSRGWSIDNEIEPMDVEELLTLRECVLQQRKEIADLKEAHRLELAAVKKETSQAIRGTGLPTNNNLINGTITVDINNAQNYTSQNVKRQNSCDLSPNFAEPTEAEYLRNVLYRYMSERETLGKESVTLARVIATVAKFSREQVEAVVAKEEERNHSWYGGTVSTVQGLVGSALASGR
uniref:GRIP domain-containing protein n=1 Tax=Parascaris univalens TaxID=6257 RepID=A0A915BDS5_PARUN